MAKGPKGQYRPVDPLKGGVLVMRLAVGDLSEAQANRAAKKLKRDGKEQSKRKSGKRSI